MKTARRARKCHSGSCGSPTSGRDESQPVQRTPATLPRCSLWNRVYSVDLISNSDLQGRFMCLGLNTLGYNGLQALTIA